MPEYSDYRIASSVNRVFSDTVLNIEVCVDTIDNDRLDRALPLLYGRREEIPNNYLEAASSDWIWLPRRLESSL